MKGKPVNAELGEFLKSRRARVQPDEVGVSSYGARRVVGLRREEVAMLAGMSPTYYTRLEQGFSRQVSAPMLERLALALQLTEAEQEHLFNLAHPQHQAPPGSGVRSGILNLLRAMDSVP